MNIKKQDSENLCLPDYSGGGIINVMASIIAKHGGNPEYPLSCVLDSGFVSRKGKTVFVLVDGFGHSSVRHLETAVLSKYSVSSMTTVFPSSTTSAITTVNTGETPSQHLYLSWYQYMKELGTIGIPLMNATRYYQPIVLSEEKGFFDRAEHEMKTVYQKLRCESAVITKEYLSDSRYTKLSSKGTGKIISYGSVSDIGKVLSETVNATDARYVYLYIDDYDTVSHSDGYASEKGKTVLREIFSEIGKAIERIDTEFDLIVTGDHGQIESSEPRQIDLSNLGLDAYLAVLPTGDNRHLNLRIRNGKEGEFLDFFERNMSEHFHIFSAKEVRDMGLYGKYENPAFEDALGDYLLVTKSDYVVGNFLFNESKDFQTGEHGGLSTEEVLIPLISYRNG